MKNKDSYVFKKSELCGLKANEYEDTLDGICAHCHDSLFKYKCEK